MSPHALAEMTAWCRAQLDDIEQVATAALMHGSGRWVTTGYDNAAIELDHPSECATIVYDEGAPTTAQAKHIALHDPEAVLADLAAKRAILDLFHEPESPYDDDQVFYQEALSDVVAHLAAALSHRPGYREEWRP
jgi:hypothetical protein